MCYGYALFICTVKQVETARKCWSVWQHLALRCSKIRGSSATIYNFNIVALCSTVHSFFMDDPDVKRKGRYERRIGVVDS